METLNLNKLFENALVPLADFLAFEAPGQKWIKVKVIVNAGKGGTLPLCIFLMYQFNNFSYSACIMTALHGSYGLIWLLKDAIIPDAQWEEPVSTIGALTVASMMMGYWLSDFITIGTKVVIPPPVAALAIMVYAIGVTIMMASDTQKYFVLKLKKGLISDGWFETCRNSNFLGEIMVYASFCICAGHYIPWAFSIFIWFAYFGGRFYNKEKSFALKKGGLDYIKRTSVILPVSLPFLPSWFSTPEEFYIEEDQKEGESSLPSPNTRARQGGKSKVKRK